MTPDSGLEIRDSRFATSAISSLQSRVSNLESPISSLQSLRRPDGWRAFTLIELLVVLAIIGTLLMLAAPRYFGSVERSKEAVLKENLFQMRDAISKYYADRGRYPESIEALATEKYLRKVPTDPITDSATTWVVVSPEDLQKGSVYDVRSGAQGKAADGTAYQDW